MGSSKKILLLGASGLVGKSLKSKLLIDGYNNILSPNSAELNLLDFNQTKIYFNYNKPEIVIIAAAKVGGILSNIQFPVDYLIENQQIQLNVIKNSFDNNVEKLLFLGSSCVYPKNFNRPITEEDLLAGSLEKTNEAYAIAKISGIKMCQAYYTQYQSDYIALMPSNLYGPNDNFKDDNSHVIPALIRKIYNAKNNNETVTIWGSGNVKREFLYVDDLAEACLFALNNISSEYIYDTEKISHINIGTGVDISISQLVGIISTAIGYDGQIIYDKSKPDGVKRKLLDISRINNLGWNAKTDITMGIDKTVSWYLENIQNL